MSILDEVTGAESEPAVQPPPSLLDEITGSVSDFFTGDDRATPQTESLPELFNSQVLGDVDIGTRTKLATVLPLTFDPM